MSRPVIIPSLHGSSSSPYNAALARVPLARSPRVPLARVPARVPLARTPARVPLARVQLARAPLARAPDGVRLAPLAQLARVALATPARGPPGANHLTYSVKYLT